MDKEDLEKDFDSGVRKVVNKVNSMNKYNIKVGDTYTSSNNRYVFCRVTDKKVGVANLATPTREICDWDITFFTQMIDDGIRILDKPTIKGKIVGYTLLKDTPDTKANVVFKKVGKNYENPCDDKGNNSTYFPEYVENNPEWFSPIYEEVKATSIIVKTTPGDVTVTKDNLTIQGEHPVSVINAEKVFASIKQLGGKYSTYDVKVETFKVGCKTFHVSDIPKLEAAIKQVS